MPGWFPSNGIDIPKGPIWPHMPGLSKILSTLHTEKSRYTMTLRAEMTLDTSQIIQLKASVAFSRYLEAPARHHINTLLTIEQFEICHARSGKDDFCTPLQYRPFFDLRPEDFPEANGMQRAVLQQLVFSIWLSDSAGIGTNQAARKMGTSEALIDHLADDFWKQEVIGWEKETWAALQIAFSQYAIGPRATDELADRYWIKPETDGEKSLCNATKMKKSGEFV